MSNYSVYLWGSHPSEDNDDCHIGEENLNKDDALEAVERLTVKNKNQALKAFKEEWKIKPHIVEYIQIVGPDLDVCYHNHLFDKERCDRDYNRYLRDCSYERGMEAGMAFGCDGYNDAMGY